MGEGQNRIVAMPVDSDRGEIIIEIFQFEHRDGSTIGAKF